MTDDERYLWLGGWLKNDNFGWWHPPNCLASFPIATALKMARKDEKAGLRMSINEVKEYHQEVGFQVDGNEAAYEPESEKPAS